MLTILLLEPALPDLSNRSPGSSNFWCLQISVEGAVTAVKHIADSHDATGLNTSRAEVLYGTHNGILGQLFLDHMTVKKGWQLKSSVHKGS